MVLCAERVSILSKRNRKNKGLWAAYPFYVTLDPKTQWLKTTTLSFYLTILWARNSGRAQEFSSTYFFYIFFLSNCHNKLVSPFMTTVTKWIKKQLLSAFTIYCGKEGWFWYQINCEQVTEFLWASPSLTVKWRYPHLSHQITGRIKKYNVCKVQCPAHSRPSIRTVLKCISNIFQSKRATKNHF